MAFAACRIPCRMSASCGGGGGDAGGGGVGDAAVSQLREQLRGQLILAPLTAGGNAAFRRLCAQTFGARVTVSEMAYARKLARSERRERALLTRNAAEQVFGVQIATNNAAEGAAAARLAATAGASFVDLNCGCPIDEVTRRGLGSALLRKPAKLVALVSRLVEATRAVLPVTVKIRTAAAGREVDGGAVCALVEALLRDGGAAAVSVHGRSAQQRYTGDCDWALIDAVARHCRHAAPGGLVVGNGDVLTHYEARHRLRHSAAAAVMAGRGALIRPWLFEEFATGREWLPTAAERVAVYRTLVAFMKERWGDDELGRRRAFGFLRLHLDFFCRYRPYAEAHYAERARDYPLIQSRERDEAQSPFLTPHIDSLEAFLRIRDDQVFESIMDALWGSDGDRDAVRRMSALADDARRSFEAERFGSTGGGGAAPARAAAVAAGEAPDDDRLEAVTAHG